MKMRCVGLVRREERMVDDGGGHKDNIGVNYYLHQCPSCKFVVISSNEVEICGCG